MRLAGVPFYPAHPTNFQKGRGRPLTKLTVHHTAALNDTLRHLWANPARNASSTFFVSDKVQEQYVDTDDTPYTNGNFTSNQESITIEVNGDWRNGYYNQQTLDNLEDLVTKILRHFPHLVLEYHMDVSRTVTLCPADLKHKGWARREFEQAKAALAPKPTPATPAPPQKQITYRKITPKRVKIKRVTRLWDFNATSWDQINKQPIGEPYPIGWIVDAVAEATNQLGSKYYMTAYSANITADNDPDKPGYKPRYTRGFNIVDCDDYVETVPVIEPPKPKPEEPKPEPIPVPTPPIDTDPETPGNSDIPQRLSALEKIVKLITDFLDKVFKDWRK